MIPKIVKPETPLANRETLIAFAKVLKAYQGGDLGLVWDKLTPDTRFRCWLSWSAYRGDFCSDLALMDWAELPEDVQNNLSAVMGDTLLFFARAANDRLRPVDGA